MKINMGNRTIEFHVQYGKGQKILLHIDSTGFITVKAPKNTEEETILEAVGRHASFIAEKLDQLEKAKDLFKAKEYTEEGKFLYLGRSCSLRELIGTDEGTEEELRERLKRFYFASCRKVVGERIGAYQKQLKVKPKSVEIVESRTKWGSCSSDKKLTFNYLLAMAPLEVIDYVIVHELCHLLHMNHDRSFWRRVGGVMPDYKEKEAYLARFGGAMTM
ncbi:M48 family metallopeptidase [Paenibacillus sp. HN-1]|uniref:M48 family metallopeptidase n=1 Tax=Paenibacillus TaxID=44249 RepID=UPI001CA860F2|nr:MULTISPECIES: SprT family zinc-dependent metalloprotease [Paenibacillus]MBY9079014.1 M48 family metallopeptidase [Paenibacillus sp. CGMCC 1.18879]MBY9087608.1 M48 family metallopeptidase [Paenibacillus sinensis]